MEENNYDFRFKRSNLVFPVGLNYFKNVAKELEKIVRNDSELKTDPIIISCEDGLTYAVQKCTFYNEFDDSVMKERAEYPLEELSDEKWNNARYLQFSIKPEGPGSSTWINLSVDRLENPRKLKFYGQQLGKEVHDEIVGKYNRFF